MGLENVASYVGDKSERGDVSQISCLLRGEVKYTSLTLKLSIHCLLHVNTSCCHCHNQGHVDIISAWNRLPGGVAFPGRFSCSDRSWWGRPRGGRVDGVGLTLMTLISLPVWKAREWRLQVNWIIWSSYVTSSRDRSGFQPGESLKVETQSFTLSRECLHKPRVCRWWGLRGLRKKRCQDLGSPADPMRQCLWDAPGYK